MKLALLSDIHGNYVVLEKCLKYIDSNNFDGVVFLGDYITDCPYPQRTISLVKQTMKKYKTWCIRGNREDAMLNHKNNPDEWTYNSQTGDLLNTYNDLTDDDLSFFKNMPISQILYLTNCKPIAICHGSPNNIREMLKSSEDNSNEWLDKIETDYLFCGHTHTLDVPMCQPIEFGTCEEGVYSLQSWIDGRDAEEEIPLLSENEQYVFGLEAGRILKKMHSIPAPVGQESWESRFKRKIDHKIKGYTDCPIKFDGADRMIDYINTNRHLLKGRPQCYQHGDYHIGNMMIDSNGRLTIIDFNRNDFGDPWEEFNRIVWCAQKSPLFASGMVNGYFNNNVPMEFWKLLALYIASNMLSFIYWAIPFGQAEINTMLNQAKEVLEWYDNMQNPVPKWYTGFQNLCICGHDCSRCITYLATVNNDNELRKQSQQFYKDEFGLDIPPSEIHCMGGRSDDIFKLCRGCPWMKCCKEKGLSACSDCTEYPCKALKEYQKKYVNKCNQI